MKIKITRKVFMYVSVIFAMTFFVAGVQAQTSVVQNPSIENVTFSPPSVSESKTIPNTVNCFDYYKFGSVQVDIESTISSTIPGVPLGFQGKIKNANDYPIVDGAVYVKVFRKQADQDKAHANSHNLVDQFFIKENISLPAKGEQDITFEWKIPSYAISGEYQVATFFTVQKKFNLLGLSFTDDIVGNTANFTITSQSQETVEFNKNTVEVNDNNYHFAAFIPKIKKEDNINVKTQLINNTKTEQIIPVIWTLYSWDAQQEKNQIETKTENITLNPNETKDLTYVVTDNKYPVYFLVAEAKYKDVKSILDIRIGKEGADKVRLNFPSITKYPLRANEQSTLFSCVHNSGLFDIVNDNKMILTLLDENGKEIHSYTYTGDISGAMMAAKDEFTPKKDYSNFTLKADLYHANQLVDSATLKYDCQQIDPKTCIAKKTSQKTQDKIFSPIIMGVILFLIALLLIIIFWKKRHSIGMIMLAILVSGFMFQIGVGRVKAKSVPWNQIVNSSFGYSGTRWGVHGWALALQNPNFSITYGAKIIDNSTDQEIVDGSSIPMGTVLKLQPQSFADTDISWFGTGYTSDSPYGHWIVNADSPAVSCDASDFVNSQQFTCAWAPGAAARFDIYMPFSVNPPIKSVSASGLTCGSPDASGNVLCTVSGAGSKSVTFNFAATFGKLYYRYYDYRSGNGEVPGCYGNNDPMRIGNCPFIGNECWPYRPDPMRPSFVIPRFESMCSSVNSSAYSLIIPAQTITYNLTAVASNNPPNTPSVAPFGTCTTNSSQSFTATATDSDGDTLRYGFDWDNNSTVDQWMPSTGYVASGTAQTASYAWLTDGNKTFKVLAQDSKGSSSGWFTVNTSCTTPTLTFSANPISVVTGSSSNLTWTTANVSSCWASGGWTDWKTNTGGSEVVIPAATTTYNLECWNSAGVSTGLKSVTVTVTPPSGCALSWGGSIASGTSTLAYSSSSVPCGSTCTSETRTCTNGVLSGTYTNQNCSETGCLGCTSPWGTSMSHGGVITAYQASSVPCGSSCISEFRSCDDGTLSGLYTNQNCTIQNCRDINWREVAP